MATFPGTDDDGFESDFADFGFGAMSSVNALRFLDAVDVDGSFTLE